MIATQKDNFTGVHSKKNIMGLLLSTSISEVEL